MPVLGAVIGALIYVRFIPMENAIVGLWAHSDGSITALMLTPFAFLSCTILASVDVMLSRFWRQCTQQLEGISKPATNQFSVVLSLLPVPKVT